MTEPLNNPTPSPAPGSTPPATAPTAPAAATTTTTPPPAEHPRRRGKLGRIVKWTFLIVLLLLIAGGVLLWVNLNSIVERTVESQSTASLNLQTELDAAALSIFGGSVRLDDLKIASPQGFDAPQMFTLDNANVNVNVGELRGDPVRIESIRLDKPKLVIERTGNKFNFKQAMDLMPKTAEAPPGEEPLRMVIGELTVTDPLVVVRPGQLNIPGITLPEEITVPIPTITLKNIGTDESAQNGAAIKDVVMQVITVMAANAANSDKLPDQLQNLMNVDVQQVVAGLAGEAQKRILEAVPGEAGRALANVVADPQALLKDPGKVVGAEAERLKQQAQQEAQKRAEGLIGNVAGRLGGTTQPSTQPATQPVDRIKQEAGKAVEKGLQDLFNRGDRKRDGERSR